MAEDEVTEISETDSPKADSDCWDIIKRKLDESGLKYTEKPEKRSFVLEYHGDDVFRNVVFDVWARKGFYNCVGVLSCNILEKQRVAVDQYLMRVNRDLLYERGKFVTAYEKNEILFSMSNLNPEDVISDLLMVLSWFEKFKVGFLAVSGGILSVDRASKLESDTPLFLGKEKYNKCLEALRTPIAIP